MSGLNQALIAEVEQEAATTRRVLERVPEDKLTWKPHWKSMSLGTLALHVAMIPGALADLASEPVREVPQFQPPEATSREEILGALEQSVARAKERLAGWDDEALAADWKMVRGTEVILAIQRVQLLRSVMLNHWYHHRGELAVYLRLLEVPVPAIYGPSADENPFG